MTTGSLTSPAAALTGTPSDPPPATEPRGATTLRLVAVPCPLCGAHEEWPVAVGEDFEYRTSADTFLYVRCGRCGLLYLNPRPAPEELDRIYPPDYHAYDFSASRYGLAYRVRERLEARRALRWTRGLPPDARILDVGCGDGFHLRQLRAHGAPGWTLHGVDASARAVEAAHRAGLTVWHGRVETLGLRRAFYDLVLLVATLEHLDDPIGVLRAVRGLVRPGGRVVVVTDNAASLDQRIFGARHWGGYHWPRHFALFTPRTLRAAARASGLDVVSLRTQLSPVNWVYSVRNLLDDYGAPAWLARRFSLRAPVSLAVGTLLDAPFSLVNRGALLCAELRSAT